MSILGSLLGGGGGGAPLASSTSGAAAGTGNSSVGISSQDVLWIGVALAAAAVLLGILFIAFKK